MAITGDPPFEYQLPYRADPDWDHRLLLSVFDQERITPLRQPVKTHPKSLPLMASQKVKRFRRVPNARRLFLQSQGLDF